MKLLSQKNNFVTFFSSIYLKKTKKALGVPLNKEKKGLCDMA